MVTGTNWVRFLFLSSTGCAADRYASPVVLSPAGPSREQSDEEGEGEGAPMVMHRDESSHDPVSLQAFAARSHWLLSWQGDGVLYTD